MCARRARTRARWRQRLRRRQAIEALRKKIPFVAYAPSRFSLPSIEPRRDKFAADAKLGDRVTTTHRNRSIVYVRAEPECDQHRNTYCEACEAADAEARGLFMRAQEVRAWVQTTLDMVNTDALCPDLSGQLAYQGVEQAARLVAARETLPR